MKQSKQNILDELRYRYACLQEVWQRGYSWRYRWFRFKEAFWYNEP